MPPRQASGSLQAWRSNFLSWDFNVILATSMPSNALDYISIRGFKSITSVEKLDLRPINLVIGPNGSGKSNFIGVFAFLHAIREGKLRDYVTAAGGAEKLLHFGSKTTKEIVLHVSFLS